MGARCAVISEFNDMSELVDFGYGCGSLGTVEVGGECETFGYAQTPEGGTLAADNCRSASVCAVPDETPLCYQYCLGSDENKGCGASEYCFPLVPERGLEVCVPADGCDAVAQNCGAGEGCYIVRGTDDSVLTTCLPAGNVAVGAACEFTAQCVPGADCIPDEGGIGACRAFCDSEAEPPTCSVGETCTPVEAAPSVPSVCNPS
jgi:hypothetical protein